MAMTDQEIFNTVAKHLLTQNAKSLAIRQGFNGKGPMCSYRGDNGRMCAVGVLVKDEFYTPDMEGKGCWQSEVFIPLIESGVLEDKHSKSLSLLDDLQYLHDSYSPDKWQYALGKLASERGLDTSVLNG